MPDVLARLRLAGRDWPPLTSALLGESVTVEAIFTNHAGVPVDVTGVTATAYRPPLPGEATGTTPALVLTRVSAGVWSGVRLLDRVGDWALHARAEAPSVAVAFGNLRVTLGGPEALQDSRGAASAGASASRAERAAIAAAAQAENATTAAAQAENAAAAASAEGLVISAPAALTRAAHQWRSLILTATGHQLTVAWAGTGDGFLCILENYSGEWCFPTLSGFTTGLVVGPDGETLSQGLRPGRLATLICRELPDGSCICRMTGDVA